MSSKLLRQLAAVLLGNLAYFAMLPHLPSALQHRAWTLDFGIVVDFLICVLLYFALGPVLGERGGARPSTK